MNLQEKLAVDRTWQANQRTLLAYIRTFLGFIALGLALIHFFPGYRSLAGGIAICLTGLVLLLAGLRSFLRSRQALRKLENQYASMREEKRI